MTESLSQWLKRAINIEYNGNAMLNSVLDLLTALFEEIESMLSESSSISTKRKYRELLKLTEEAFGEYEGLLTDLYKDNALQIAGKESSWLKDFMKALGYSYLIPKNIANQVLFTPFAGNQTYETVAKTAFDQLRKATDAALRVSYLVQDDISKTSERILNIKPKVEKNLTSDTKTFNTAMFRATDLAMFKINRQKVMYLAVLDSHTCMACAEYNGKVFDITAAPMLPLHNYCRCTEVPIELMESEDEQPTFSEWIEELDDDEKYEVLGKTRFKLYKEGVPVTRFVDNGKILTLDELK